MGYNKFPLWKNLLIIVIVLIGLIYSLPNLFGEDYAVQIASVNSEKLAPDVIVKVEKELEQNNIKYKSIQLDQEQYNLLVRLDDSDDQLKASELLNSVLGRKYIVALNLAPATPSWLAALGAEPMKLGLDLRGGVHFLMEVDTKSAVKRQTESDLSDMRAKLRTDKIRYQGSKLDNYRQISFRFVEPVASQNSENNDSIYDARDFLQKNFPQYVYKIEKEGSVSWLNANLKDLQLQQIRDYAMEQSISTLRKRVNELGVSEAVVQRQGMNRIVVELPGIQDTARAKDIIGKTATVEFRMAYPGVTQDSRPPVGYTTLPLADGKGKVWVANKVILTGNSIIGAFADVDQRSGKPIVSISLGGSSSAIYNFSKTTRENIGKPMATVYVETKTNEVKVGDKIKKEKVVNHEAISVATIQDALGKQFQISGLKSMQEAKNLALLLRAGALPAPVDIVSERTIGPSLGKENISMGIKSVVAGLLLVLIFMGLYYSIFGIVANIALLMNLVILVAICSMIHVTMTLPGIAGIVLTLGMAIDANVLIFERIREELRSGASTKLSIHAGYEKAFATIVDANVTTLIAAVVLFTIGSGAVKGFAVTLTIGLITSMFTAITGSRAIVNVLYGRKSLHSLPIGIKTSSK